MEGARVDGMTKMYTAIVAAFAGDKGPGLLADVREAFIDRVREYTQAPKERAVRLERAFRENEEANQGFEQACAGGWKVVATEREG